MRIGIDAWGLSGPLAHTGIGQYATHLMHHLAATPGLEIVAYGRSGESRPPAAPAGVEWRSVSTPVSGRAEGLLSRMLLLRRAVRRDGIDVFHSPGVHVRASLPPVPSLGCPLVATVHDLIPLTYYGDSMPRRSRWFYRWNLGRALRAHAVITVSQAASEAIRGHAPGTGDRLHVIPNGVEFPPNPDVASLARHGVQAPYILYAGSYEPRKNFAVALSAYACLVRDGAPHGLVAIVEGDSGHKDAALAHLASLNLGGRVRLLHDVPEYDLRALYTHAALLCFPSLAEGFGFPPVQAAACGTPVVSTSLPSVRETLGDHALYADTTDPRELAQALRTVIDDERVRARLTNGAAEHARRFSWVSATQAHVRVYADVLASVRTARTSGRRGT